MSGAHLHLLLNHLPVIGTLLALLLLAYAQLRGSQELTRASLGIFAIAAVMGLAAFLTGEPAEEVVKRLPGIEKSAIHEHEEAALVATWLLGLVGAVSLGGLIAFRKRDGGVPRRFGVLVLALSLFPTLAMARTANLGGKIRHTEILPGTVAPRVDTHEEENTMSNDTLRIPEAMRAEHQELHASLEAATKVPGPVGEAAREVARVLHPHFLREEEIALPPLGLLASLAEGKVTGEMGAVLPMTDALRAELPKMLEEHQAIHAALTRLADTAAAEKQPEYQRLAESIMHHAATEEEVSYPAALVVGDYVRMKLGS
jgi:hypothetical protein